MRVRGCQGKRMSARRDIKERGCQGDGVAGRGNNTTSQNCNYWIFQQTHLWPHKFVRRGCVVQYNLHVYQDRNGRTRQMVDGMPKKNLEKKEAEMVAHTADITEDIKEMTKDMA